MKFVWLILTVLSFNVFALPDHGVDVSLEHHIANLAKEGHINDKDIQKSIFDNNVDDQKITQRRLRARGIASTLSKVKVYRIINKPIVIQP